MICVMYMHMAPNKGSRVCRPCTKLLHFVFEVLGGVISRVSGHVMLFLVLHVMLHHVSNFYCFIFNN